MLGVLIAKQKVRNAFSYFNERNMEKFLSLWGERATFTYPGDLAVSGKKEGKAAVSEWFNNLMDAGPAVHFSLKNICVSNIFDMVGTNDIAVEWDNAVTNRRGVDMLIEGVSMVRIKKGKIVAVQDYIFDLNKLPIAWCEEA